MCKCLFDVCEGVLLFSSSGSTFTLMDELRFSALIELSQIKIQRDM